MSNLGKAISMASVGFENKTDRAGEPYIMHCLRVMNNPRCNTLERKMAAILHDTLEDEVLEISDLYDANFPNRVISLVLLLTHDKKVLSYDDYIKRIASDDDATAIKLSDLEDNSQITRLKGLGKKDFDRMEKYHRAYTYLSRR